MPPWPTGPSRSCRVSRSTAAHFPSTTRANGRRNANAADEGGLLEPRDVGALLKPLRLEGESAAGRTSPAGGALEIEIGCGNGHFLAEYAAGRPASTCIGLEIKKSRCLKAKAKIEKRGLANAHVVHGRAEEVIGLLPEDSVDIIHLYFPDPWPKSKHRCRRFLRAENLDRLVRILKAGGLILFATDFFDYYLQSKVLFLVQGSLRLSADSPCASVFQSVFSRRFLKSGKPIHTIAVRKATSR